MERKYNRYNTNKTTEIMGGLQRMHRLKEESVVDQVSEVDVSSGNVTKGEAFKELVALIKENLPDDVELYVEPIVDRGDILVLQYGGHTFELVAK